MTMENGNDWEKRFYFLYEGYCHVFRFRHTYLLFEAR